MAFIPTFSKNLPQKGLWGQTVEVLIYDEALRIEQAEHPLVSYPCVYDTVRRRIVTIDGQGRQP